MAFLSVWQWSWRHLALKHLLVLALATEAIVLLVNLLFNPSIAFLVLFGLANGLYNCFFWMTQRSLFLQRVDSSDSGRQYGNFQIFVTLFLKAGILIGGLLMERDGYVLLIIGSLIIITISAIWFLSCDDLQTTAATKQLTQMDEVSGEVFSESHREPSHHTLGDTCADAPPAQTAALSPTVTVIDALQYRDRHRSRRIFVIDGLFLFLESHFWTLSLFWVTDQNFTQLGLTIIVLGALFGLAFFVAKNTIDRIPGNSVFTIAVLLYALSWFLRVPIGPALSTEWLYLLIILISFFSSFFRLTFNKRFYDVAAVAGDQQYLVIKSYVTQLAVFVCFLAIAVASVVIDDDARVLQLVYLVAGFGALVYGYYRYLID